MFMILLIRELAETEFNVNKKLIIGSSLIVLNYANMLCFTQNLECFFHGIVALRFTLPNAINKKIMLKEKNCYCDYH